MKIITHHYAWLLIWVLQLKFRFSCLQGKHSPKLNYQLLVPHWLRLAAHFFTQLVEVESLWCAKHPAHQLRYCVEEELPVSPLLPRSITVPILSSKSLFCSHSMAPSSYFVKGTGLLNGLDSLVYPLLLSTAALGILSKFPHSKAVPIHPTLPILQHQTQRLPSVPFQSVAESITAMTVDTGARKTEVESATS